MLPGWRQQRKTHIADIQAAAMLMLAKSSPLGHLARRHTALVPKVARCTCNLRGLCWGVDWLAGDLLGWPAGLEVLFHVVNFLH